MTSHSEESQLQKLEASLREAIQKARAEGYTIIPNDFGVVEAMRFDIFTWYSPLKCCCPLGAFLLGKTVKQSGMPAFRAVAEALGLNTEEIQSFTFGFDSEAKQRCLAGSFPLFALGQKLRLELCSQQEQTPKSYSK